MPIPLPGSLTLRAICEMPLLAGIDVLAGASGLDRFVSRLNVMTVPDIAEWTKPYELLLTTGYPLQTILLRVGDLVEELDNRSVTALAIKLDRYTNELPDRALRVADRLGFPLLGIPQNVAFDDILSLVLSEIANRQARTLLRARDVHAVLLRASLHGGLDAVLSGLSAALGWPGVWCVDDQGVVHAECCTDDLRDDLVERGLRAPDGGRLRDQDLARSWGTKVACVDLPVSDLGRDRLVVVHDAGGLDAQEQMVLEQAAMVAALCISKSVAIAGVNRRYRSNALHGLLLGRRSEALEVVANAASFDWDLDRPMRVVLAKPARQQKIRVRDGALTAWESLVHGVDVRAATATLGPILVTVCGADVGDDALWQRAVKQLSRIYGVEVYLGISDPVDDAAGLAQAWSHAVTAADFARGSAALSPVRRYEDLGMLRLVGSANSRAQIDDYLTEILGSVLSLEGHQRDDLLQTLDTLFRHNLNVAETARVMHFHYNTLRYRVRKLENLIGPFTQDLRLAVRVGLALEIRPLSKHAS